METVEEGYRSLIKEKLNIKTPKNDPFSFELYIHCLKDIPSSDSSKENNKFPFKTTKDHLGIVFDRKFEQANSIRFWMFQEKKQKDKNQEYISILKSNELISDQKYRKMLQPKEMIEMELNKKNQVVINLKELCQN